MTHGWQTIQGTIPSKSNCYRIVTIGGHGSLAKTSGLKAYERSFYMQVGAYRNLGITGYRRISSFEDLKEASVQIRYNSKIAAEYLRYLRQMAEEFGLDDDVRVTSLSKYPDVFTMEEEPADPDQLWEVLGATLAEAAENFVNARAREGEFLRNDLLGKEIAADRRVLQAAPL